MKEFDEPQPRFTTEELSVLFEKIQGSENKEIATKAYVTALTLPHNNGLLERDINDLTEAERIEWDWFVYGLTSGTEGDIGFAAEMIDDVTRRRDNKNRIPRHGNGRVFQTEKATPENDTNSTRTRRFVSAR